MARSGMRVAPEKIWPLSIFTGLMAGIGSYLPLSLRYGGTANDGLRVPWVGGFRGIPLGGPLYFGRPEFMAFGLALLGLLGMAAFLSWGIPEGSERRRVVGILLGAPFTLFALAITGWGAYSGDLYALGEGLVFTLGCGGLTVALWRGQSED